METVALCELLATDRDRGEGVTQRAVLPFTLCCRVFAALPQRTLLSSSVQLCGLTKKGKEFYRLEPLLAEPIRMFAVLNSAVWLAGEATLTAMDNDRRVGECQLPALITALEVRRRHQATHAHRGLCRQQEEGVAPWDRSSPRFPPPSLLNPLI